MFLPDKIQFGIDTPTPPGLVKTKVICTIGPRTQSKEMLGKLVEAGMNVVRLNFSHGNYEDHSRTINNLREYLAESKKLCAILLDTKGPEIRSGMLDGHKEIRLEAGSKFTLVTGVHNKDLLGDVTKVYVDYANLPKVVQVGKKVLIDDGLISLAVTGIDGGHVECTVENTGMLGERKGVNLPGVAVDLPAVTEKDRRDIAFGIEQGVDFIAASFVRKAADVQEIRELLGGKGRGIRIISKIENEEGLQNFDEILAESDGIMVARGDLGVEIPIEKVSLAQKMMIQRCNVAGKPVITATQMLESMVKNPRPTRAEATDVANAVFDGSDAVMLSGETAKGDYPVETVTIMAKICRQAEAAIDYEALYLALRQRARNPSDPQLSVVESITSSAVKTAHDLDSALIIALTETGYTGRLISKYRPDPPVLCLTANEQTARQLLISRGLFPIIVGSMIGSDSIIARTVSHAKEMGLCKPGQLVVATGGRRDGVSGHTNLLKVINVV